MPTPLLGFYSGFDADGDGKKNWRFRVGQN
jgi:hypothetical protein